MHNDRQLKQIARSASGCQYGHCSLLGEAGFRRILSLERKRSERSRKPFILVLVNIERLWELNGDRNRSVQEVATAMASVVRETDTSGWYSDGAVLGTIFSELGNTVPLKASVDSIVDKVGTALEKQLGKKASERIKTSWHVFPEEWSEKKPREKIDIELYPDLQPGARSDWLHSLGKRFVDVGLSTLALLALSPLLLLIALVVKITSRGPVLCQQQRVGQFGKQFTFLKFRSMQVANDSIIHEQYVRDLITGRLQTPKNGVFKIENDPRVTAIGRFLRKTSLDELPQFWNVLVGEMSLVGPRPPLPYEVSVYDIWHRRRLLEAKPGITGLWQVTARSRTCFDDMVRLDLRYVQSSCLSLDLKILLQTPWAVVAGDGAY